MVEMNDAIEETENHLAKKYSLGFKQKYNIVCIASIGLIVLGFLISWFFKEYWLAFPFYIVALFTFLERIAGFLFRILLRDELKKEKEGKNA